MLLLSRKYRSCHKKILVPFTLLLRMSKTTVWEDNHELIQKKSQARLESWLPSLIFETTFITYERCDCILSYFKNIIKYEDSGKKSA